MRNIVAFFLLVSLNLDVSPEEEKCTNSCWMNYWTGDRDLLAEATFSQPKPSATSEWIVTTKVWGREHLCEIPWFNWQQRWFQHRALYFPNGTFRTHSCRLSAPAYSGVAPVQVQLIARAVLCLSGNIKEEISVKEASLNVRFMLANVFI